MDIRFICGKGGVGKSAVCAALSEHLSRQDPVLCVAIDQPESLSAYWNCPPLQFEPEEVRPGIWGVHLDRQKCLDDFVLRYFKLGFLSRWILEHPIYPYVTAVSPGIREYLILDRIRTFAEAGTPPWKTILVDTPATGHGIHLLNIATPLAAALKLGPLKFRLRRTEEMIQDESISRVILVTTPSDLPVQETIELADLLRKRSNLTVSHLIVNRHETFSIPPSLKAATDPDQPAVPRCGPISPEIDNLLEKVLSAADFLTRKHDLEERQIQLLAEHFPEPKLIIPRFTDTNPDTVFVQMTTLLTRNFNEN
jgi:anion-transporting  ArsA/GET3 family ATPase